MDCMVALIVWHINKDLMDWAIDMTLDAIKFMFTNAQNFSMARVFRRD